MERGLDLLPETIPSSVRRVLLRCLARDRNLRYRDIGDVRIELERARTEPRTGEQPGGRRLSRTLIAGVAPVLTLVAGLVLGAAGWKLLGPSTPAAPQDVTRLSITLPLTYVARRLERRLVRRGSLSWLEAERQRRSVLRHRATVPAA